MNDKCRSCKYSSIHGRTVVCDYFLATKTPRGCPAGKECDKWEEKTCNKGKNLWLQLNKVNKKK